MARKKPDKKAMALARLIQNVADAGGPMEAAKVVDDRAYRRGIRDGKRAQQSKDIPILLVSSAAALLIGQLPHLFLMMKKKKDAEAARKRAEAAQMERIRLQLEQSLREGRKTD